MNATQKQRDFITSLLNRIGVETAYKAGILTIDQAIDQGRKGGYRSPRDVARHTNKKQAASKTIDALLKMWMIVTKYQQAAQKAAGNCSECGTWTSNPYPLTLRFHAHVLRLSLCVMCEPANNEQISLLIQKHAIDYLNELNADD